jgi:hypothetical protein
MTVSSVPVRYLPSQLSRKDRKKQLRALRSSKTSYKRNKYYVRPKLASFKSRKSKHILRAEKMYGVVRIVPGRQLAEKTKCTVDALKQIVRKGEGAYYSSGSRPNQTARSWGLARLASSITGGKASAIDFAILERGCNHKTSKAYRLAKPPKYGRRHTRRIKALFD